MFQNILRYDHFRSHLGLGVPSKIFNSEDVLIGKCGHCNADVNDTLNTVIIDPNAIFDVVLSMVTDECRTECRLTVLGEVICQY